MNIFEKTKRLSKKNAIRRANIFVETTKVAFKVTVTINTGSELTV